VVAQRPSAEARDLEWSVFGALTKTLNADPSLRSG
jgi:hypothetical protein